MISYINDTGYFWSTITKNGEYRVTTSFIREVQGRCPRLSQRDHKCLQRALTTEGALSYLPQNAREHIYRNIIQYNHTIPSLYTLFEDLKYIKQCRDVLKKLVTGDKYLPKGQTLKKCFLKHFQASPRPIIQTNHRVFEEADGLPQNIYFLVAYWQIWLCAMRYWPDCLTRSARKVPEAEDQCFESSLRPQFWTLMGKSALRLGFNSPRINAFASGHEELSMDSQVCYPGFTAEADREHWERYGIPYEDKHLYDRNSLFIQRLLVPQQQVGSIGAGEDITTLFVRRTLFLRLFPETKSLMQGSPPQSQGSPQVRQSQRLSDEPVVPTPISSALARIDHHLQRSTISTTPRNVSPSQEVEMTDHRTGPEGGDYIVERWTPQGSETLRTETRDNWLNILRTLQRKKYLLYEVGLKALDGSQLAQYRGKKLIAAHPKVTHNSIRQAYGLST